MHDIHAAIIHDIKNQLTELALRLEGRGDATLETGIAMNAARRLAELLLVERYNAGALQANVDSACPADMLQELMAEYQALFPALQITLLCDQAPEFWFYDAGLVRLALGNATHNACRYARNRVQLGAYKKDAQLVFEIRDDGPGFPETLLNADVATPAPVSQRGTGLGLYLAHKIAALHSLNNKAGQVQLANDNGAVFCLKLA